MPKKDNITTFFDETYSSPPKKNFSMNKTIYNHIDEIWSIDLADMIDYKISNNKGFRYIFILIDNFSNYLCAIPLKNKYSQTVTDALSKILSTSKRAPLELGSDSGKDWYNSIFQYFLKGKNFHHYSRFTEKGPSIAERVYKTIRSLLKKPVFEKGNADWINELPSVINNLIILFIAQRK